MLNKELPPETAAQAYRHGYYDAMVQVWSDLCMFPKVGKRPFISKLDDFIYGPLTEWKNGDTSQKMLPPQLDIYKER